MLRVALRRRKARRAVTADPESLFGAQDAELEHSVAVAVAGVPVRVESNSSAVTSAAMARYAAASLSGSIAAAPCSLRVSVRRDTEPHGNSPDVRWHFQDRDRALVTGPGLAAAIDLAAGRAVVDVDEAFLRNRALFQRAVLEGIPFTLISRKDRHPVHAAVLRAGKAALLLHGPSGVGKSTLAYVAHRAGIDVLADDASRVQLEPEVRLWGDGTSPRVHLLEHARHDFAELRGQEPDWLSGSGVPKLSVQLLPPGGAARSPFASLVRVCLLARHRGIVALRAATSGEIRDALLRAPEAALDLAPDRRARVASALAAPGGWHLTLSDHPSDAVPHLRAMLAQIASTRK